MKFIKQDKYDEDQGYCEWDSDCDTFTIILHEEGFYTLGVWDDETGDCLPAGRFNTKMEATKMARTIKKERG